jgi:hypothetical protein
MTTEKRSRRAAFGDVAKSMMTPAAPAPRMSEEEALEVERQADAEEEGDGPTEPESALEQAADQAGEAEQGDRVIRQVPVPGGLVIPPYANVGYVIFKPGLTGRPDLGLRTCVTWGLTVADERLARQAARGDSSRTYEEMAKRMIRVVDGAKADWTGGNPKVGSVNRFWEQIGPKARMLLVNQYMQTHSPTVEETADFFLGCCTFRTSLPG